MLLLKNKSQYPVLTQLSLAVNTALKKIISFHSLAAMAMHSVVISEISIKIDLGFSYFSPINYFAFYVSLNN